MNKHCFTFEQYCNVIGRNIILEETTFHNGAKKIRCLNAHKCETMNGGCLNNGYEDYNPRVYDDILRTGKKIFAVAGDDNHNGAPDDSRFSDSGHAWTVIKAEKLEYRTVTKAM